MAAFHIRLKPPGWPASSPMYISNCLHRSPPTFFPALSRTRFREVVEIVPTTRIVYGSYAIEIPENHWMSAKLAKRALGGSLGDLVAEGVLDLDEAHQTGDLILNSNATKLLA